MEDESPYTEVVPKPVLWSLQMGCAAKNKASQELATPQRHSNLLLRVCSLENEGMSAAIIGWELH
jgi:hypothetical protein